MIKTTADLPYEPPAILVLGPVTELTLGAQPGFEQDGSATYDQASSDARLKRGIVTISGALPRIRQAGRTGVLSTTHDDSTVDARYSPPTIVVLGPVSELTLGGSAVTGPYDATGTYYEPSDSRLKRDVRTMAYPLRHLRAGRTSIMSTAASADHRDPGYAAPALVQLGPIADLTLGGEPGADGDGAATYLPDAPSDARLKRGVRTIADPLATAHRLRL
jgi:hypothetical protein